MLLAPMLLLLGATVAVVPSNADAATSTQTIAAGTSQTNLPTETTFSGAQSPPYICCWSQQGQFVTFAFTVGGGQTGMALRYSAGTGAATRKLELDGAVLVANQSFPATASWNAWSAVTVNANLAAGTHTLKVWHDATAGSSRFLNLDNLTVTSQAPVPAPVSTALPLISGAPQVGSTLSTTAGTWTNSPTSFAYQWARCNPGCTPVGTSTNTYIPVAGDIGSTITATVTATNAGGPSTPATSTPTSAVTNPAENLVVAAGTSATNLPKESNFTGAQNPPYVCCWNQQGQFVTFSFNTPSGLTTLALRYSAGAATATRKIELDGAVLAANQAFPGTASWNTWSTVTVTPVLTAGAHTLKVWFDATAGSAQWMNLDNLAVAGGTAPPVPTGV
jgi:hypothetical protein